MAKINYERIGQEYDIGLGISIAFSEFNAKLHNSGNIELANAFSKGISNVMSMSRNQLENAEQAAMFGYTLNDRLAAVAASNGAPIEPVEIPDIIKCNTLNNSPIKATLIDYFTWKQFRANAPTNSTLIDLLTLDLPKLPPIDHDTPDGLYRETNTSVTYLYRDETAYNDTLTPTVWVIDVNLDRETPQLTGRGVTFLKRYQQWIMHPFYDYCDLSRLIDKMNNALMSYIDTPLEDLDADRLWAAVYDEMLEKAATAKVIDAKIGSSTKILLKEEAEAISNLEMFTYVRKPDAFYKDTPEPDRQHYVLVVRDIPVTWHDDQTEKLHIEFTIFTDYLNQIVRRCSVFKIGWNGEINQHSAPIPLTQRAIHNIKNTIIGKIKTSNYQLMFDI